MILGLYGPGIQYTMIFQEKKIENGYHYKVEDIFGVVEMTANTKLDKELLDDMVVHLLAQNIQAETVTGKVSAGDTTVEYVFKKAPIWSEIDEEIPCENTPISTKRTVSESIVIALCRVTGWNWSRKFVAAFREAWRNARK